MNHLYDLVKRGEIVDGAVIRARGRVRVRDGEVFIETLHDQIEVEGKNFESMCFGTNSENSTVAQLDQEIEDLRKKVKSLSQELGTKNRNIIDLQIDLQKEREANHLLLHKLSEKETLLEDTTQELLFTRAKAHDRYDEFDKLLKQVDMERQIRIQMQEEHNQIVSELEKKLKECQVNLNKSNYALETSKQEQLNARMTIHELKNEVAAAKKQSEDASSRKGNKIRRLFGKKSRPSIPGRNEI